MEVKFVEFVLVREWPANTKIGKMALDVSAAKSLISNLFQPPLLCSATLL